MNIYKKTVSGLGFVFALGALTLACAAPPEDGDGGDVAAPTTKSDEAKPRWLGEEAMYQVDEGGGTCGQSCSVTCANGSCSASAPRGQSVCCSCSASGTASCY